jgi:hypothetical protein
MKLLTTTLLFISFLTVTAQTSPPRNWIDSEARYSDSSGKELVVHNSFPRGGGPVLNLGGKKYSYVVFFTRLVNESSKPLELNIQFPADSFAIFRTSSSFIKIFLPADTMTPEKIDSIDFGLTNLQYLLDKRLAGSRQLRKTIPSAGEWLFYSLVIFNDVRGAARSAYVLEGNDVFYKIKVGEDSAVIPCGRIVFSK